MKRKARNESYRAPTGSPRHRSPFVTVQPAQVKSKLPQTPADHRDAELVHEDRLGAAIIRLYRAVLVNELPSAEVRDGQS